MIVTFALAAAVAMPPDFGGVTTFAADDPCPTCLRYSSEGYADWYEVLPGVPVIAPALPPAISSPIPEPEPAIVILLGLGAIGFWKGRANA